jgi:hypothetical protein
VGNGPTRQINPKQVVSADVANRRASLQWAVRGGVLQIWHCEAGRPGEIVVAGALSDNVTSM